MSVSPEVVIAAGSMLVRLLDVILKAHAAQQGVTFEQLDATMHGADQAHNELQETP